MGVDLLTLVAQIVNLIILIWLLKRFMYQPILNMVDARQALIDKNIRGAQQAINEAHRQELAYTKKVQDFEKERQTRLNQTIEDAEVLKKSLLKEVQESVKSSQKQWANDLLMQKKSFELGVQNLIMEYFRQFAKNSLAQMADIHLQDLIIEKFKTQISQMPVKDKKALIIQWTQVKQITIFSDLKLSPEQREQMIYFVKKTAPTDAKFTFKQKDELICGIELQADEQTVSWNLGNYLQDFEKQMDNAFDELIYKE